MNSVPSSQNPARQAVSIASFERLPRHISISWNDGEQADFQHIWLRDNCGCDQCGDRAGGHRYLEIASIDPDIAPAGVELDASGAIQIKWQGDGHLTRYTPQWLRAHACSEVAIAERQPRPVLWDAQLNDQFPIWEYDEMITDQAARLQMFEHIGGYGFAVLNGVPIEVEQIEKLAAIFGFVRETHYGRVFELISTPQQRILAQTSHAIRPHNDELFREPIPGLFMMHCLRASECGGGASVFVDGFKVAQTLREQHPEHFELLTRVPIPHRRFLVDEVDDVALAAKWPAIELDNAGRVIAVHVNERTMAPLDVAGDRVEPMYRALQTMLKLTYEADACITHRLEAGQAAVLDNHRVLHARNAFNGNRHIRQCHVDRDEFFSRMRALYRRFGRDAQYREYV